MKTFEQKTKEASQKIRMRASERALLREQVLSFMEYHPLIQAPLATTVAKKAKSHTKPYTEKFSYILFAPWQIRSVGGVMALLLLVVTPLLAEHTVPGDVLYSMKVRVNEEVLSKLSFSSYEKVAWETRRVERRIAEARLLAKEGKLTDAVEAQITETVKEHTASAQKELAVLRESNADQAAVAQVVLESAFDVQSAVLATDQQASSTNGSDDQIRALATVMRDARATLGPLTENSATLSSYELFVASVEEATTRARDLYASIDASISSEEREDVQRRLEDIDRRIGTTHAVYDANATGPATEGLKGALSDTQKLISFMTDIDVRTSVSLETLVPKQLTNEERAVYVSESKKDIRATVALVTARLPLITDTAVREKVALGLGSLSGLLARMEANALEDAEGSEREASALAKDLRAMTDYLGAVPAVSTEGAGAQGVRGTSTEPSLATTTRVVTDIATSTPLNNI